MQVLHQLPGRLRAKSGKLYDKRLSQYINVYCDNLYGVKCCSVNHRTATVLVVFDPEKTSAGLILKNLEDAVMAGGPARELPEIYDEYLRAARLRDRAKRGLMIYGLIYIAYKIKQALSGKFTLSGSLRLLQAASVVTVAGGYPLIKEVYRRLVKPLPVNPDKLLWAASQFFTIVRESARGVLLLWLKELGDYVKFSADADCFRILGQNMNKTAGLARLKDGGEESFVPLRKLSLGDVIEVREGEMVAAEGDVLEGRAQVDSLYYAGHPMVRRIAAGSRVYEGMSVLDGGISAAVTGLPDVGEKPDITEKDVPAYQGAGKYAHAVTYPALGLGIVSTALTGSFSGVLTVMMAASPSAVNSAFSTGIQNYAALLDKNKIYLRNPYVIGKLANIRHIVFDKTGTLTTTRMELTQVHAFGSSHTAGALLKIAAACEADHFHPISVTLQEAAGDFDAAKVQSSDLVPSRGIDAVYDGRRVLIGNRALMDANGVDITEGLPLYEASEGAHTPVFMALDGRLTAVMILDETLRKNARELMRRLKLRGTESLTLVTGDSQERARNMALMLGMESAYGGCSAADKLEIIERLKKSGPVLMVGDGINDLPSMRASDVSVSFIDGACDKVKLQSDCIIYEADMARLPDMLSLSEKSYRLINQSIAASKIYNGVLGTLALMQRINIFGAKSFNTINSLMAVGLNQRILVQRPEKYRPRSGSGAPDPAFVLQRD